MERKARASKPTNLVQLQSSVLGTELVQQLLGGIAVRAVRLGEDDDAVLVDQGLGLGLCGSHGGGVGSGEGAEEALEDERNIGLLDTSPKRNRE